jgi:Predicted ABC-type transport system involved in lysophospholipase L1 biosynthesis, permease component
VIAQSEVARTNAIQVGSRIEYRLLMAGDAQNTQRFEKLYKQKFGDQSESGAANSDHAQVQDAAQSSLKLRNASEGNTRLMKPIANLETFLQLANILTILLCGIAIALTSQRYVQQNQDAIALMRCIGSTKQQILSAYLALLLVVLGLSILFGSLIGLGLGLAYCN